MTDDVSEIAKAIVKAKTGDKGGNGTAKTRVSDELSVAASNVLSASTAGDSDELASSLREFISLCRKGD